MSVEVAWDLLKEGQKGGMRKIASNEIIANIIKLVRDIKFGQVSIIIQDGEIIQVDKVEKIRLR